ncbi:methylglyoxal synthase [Terasakiella sp. A23]|uniref:methylglyoxal synthase n=1 Tax=Terasakiella sp. FCG-A23 TaxID=3080561 RepID=UPI002954E1A1|nr:methylglyoxal synthase [Terasakiella sp. A23]MDV7341763.1 methylglyoxal synthase [Terasakiella sp. A23]
MITRPLNVGLVAHDATKAMLAEWVAQNRDGLHTHRLYATGTTARVLAKANPELDITALKSGPFGGDQQLGALICEGRLDALIFFQDPMTAQPHDVDVKALVRMSTLYDVPLACNTATADLIITSPGFARLMDHRFDDRLGNWNKYLSRDVSNPEHGEA